jgi:mono/diheme cytochrome c family protein
MKSSLVTVAALVLGSALAVGAARAPSKDVTEGRVLYTRYCASCHGLDADGRGPVAPVLAHSPTDLRRLGARYGSPLPADRVGAHVDGREEVAAHGARDMPVWGERFRSPEHAIDPRIREIVAYLDSIQVR